MLTLYFVEFGVQKQLPLRDFLRVLSEVTERLDPGSEGVRRDH